MNLKPAGLKTIREAIERLMNGEVFYSTEGCEIIYDDVNTSCGLRLYSPFKIISGTDICEPVNYLWEQVADWQIKYEWENDIGDGVLCWVSDYDRIPDESNFLKIITAYRKGQEYPYESEDDAYRFATPLTLEEAKEYIRG